MTKTIITNISIIRLNGISILGFYILYKTDNMLTLSLLFRYSRYSGPVVLRDSFLVLEIFNDVKTYYGKKVNS